jgi:pyruvate,water dikinase
MGEYVLPLDEVDKTQVSVVGGKGANLGELARIAGVRVPAGFCVTTAAFRRFTQGAPSLGAHLEQLRHLAPGDRQSITAVSAELRDILEATDIPGDVAAAITTALSGLDDAVPYAVRSSATAEDLPGASFAGQQDSYLNVVGPAAVLDHVRRCWASLFTERAVTYRLHNGYADKAVAMAVVVQRMVPAQASGVLFTADPVTSNRKVAAVEATVGLGEALVSGRVNADRYTVRDDQIVEKTIQERPALTDAQVIGLVQLGRRIEAHFGCPQDIEWCVDGDGIWIVQSRPITTLYPIPDGGDAGNRVYVSVGHGQMMTDAMKPLGLSFWQLTTPAPTRIAGGRLFVDVTQSLASPAKREALLAVMGKGDPLIRDALETVLQRSEFIPLVDDDGPSGPPPGGVPTPIETDPAIVTELIAQNQDSVAALKCDISGKSTAALLEFILSDIQEMRRLLFDPRSHAVFMSAMEATWWLNEHLEEWLGEKNAADTLTQSVPSNVTSQMGLALLDVADVIRPHPAVVAFLQDVSDDGFLDDLAQLEGGAEAREALQGFLDTYGMRCVGEIDITRPRWSERPSALLPMILANVRNFEPGAAARRFEQGRQEALAKADEVLDRLRALPDGARKADETRQMIDRVRTFMGYREYPKYGMISRYFVYKQALLQEADRLVQAGVLHLADEIFFLSFAELHDVVRTNQADAELISRRKEAFRSYQALTPPRVLTSDGEAVAGAYRRDDVPTGALVGLPVSAGTIEGRARVILDVAHADLEPGDILVTAHTDPSWSPLFLAVTGLVTEVGGLMTHGAVIAREYGLPAVVGVAQATSLIRDGQRIRVNGSDGYIQILTDVPA